ncbi:molybdopterin molybdotransferase MoeA [Microbacterium laevaniformans]|uniref:molybdopterin molybdotransferase MoeA n=1 Tax=Microbacterium laevaniformans TaxID=36807 RepID=UPI00195BBF16|nr:gephyrin-like molybdotransferase Glp [Microbacterium laevaniformans]MBM7753321.1 molybdopterin molybdotransferase [Microbacterium laevaniformans]GLJ65439.1 molybdopterin molybdenumtransferase MoeA [Microbacterium laevaniformans]
MTSHAPLRTVEEQLADVLAAVRPLPAVRLPLTAATGATLREPVRATLDIPVFDNSAMDGFAVRFADVAHASPEDPAILRVVADLPAGTSHDPPLAPGEAARIMTGSPVPSDADAIVPFEDTEGGLADSLRNTTVRRAPRTAGAFVRRAGDDLRAGDVVLETGVVLGPLQIAAATAAGRTHVVVSARPRVGIVSTGSELAPAGTPLRRGQIPESNGVLLAGLVAAAGAEVVAQVVVDDEGEALRNAVAALLAAPVDAVVFSGGVSAGAFEVVRTELAAAMTFTRVAMQPGKPQGFGTLPTPSGIALLFGLPGNPVSAAVSFEVFVRPALLTMQGRRTVERARLTLPAGTSWRTPGGRRQYLPAVIDTSAPTWTVHPATAGGSGSHLAGGLGLARALAVVAADIAEVREGDPVQVHLLEGWDA